MFAIIDLETTGGNAIQDRITEVAIILHDGQQTIGKFSSLVNPGCFIPSYITDITGIDDEMVAYSPTFRELTSTILEMTEGCVFVAHNVGFDYNFLKESFERLGIEFKRPKLCTVKTSRRLMPGLRSYSLGRLCEHLGIRIHDRHRAMGDAKATVTLLEHLIELDPNLLEIDKKLDEYSRIPLHLDRSMLDEIPERPGLFFLHDEIGRTLYAGNSRSIRRDTLKALRQEGPTKGKIDLGRIRDISWELTGNELLAVLRMPAEASRREFGTTKTPPTRKYKAAVFAYQDQLNYTRLYIGPHRKGQPNIGEFPTPADAIAALKNRVSQYDLCPVLSGIDNETCEGEKCSGACQGKEASKDYNLRLEKALEGLGFPFPRFFVLGDGRSQEEVSIICVENGTCLGYAYLDASQSWTDPDQVISFLNPFQELQHGARIIRQFLPKMKSARIVPY